MRSSSGLRRAGTAQATLAAAALLLLLAAAHSADTKKLAVFAPQASYSVGVTDREGREYVNAFELLAPLARVTTNNDAKKWELNIGATQAQFEIGKDKARIRGQKVSLGGKFLAENGAPLLPLRGIPAVVGALLNTRVEYHEGSGRLFLGGTATHFTAELRRSGDRSSLVVQFTAPVNPTIGTEPGSLRMLFTKDPVVAGAEHFAFDDKLIPSATYSETAGAGEITVSGTAPLMATFADNNRTIIVSAAPTAATAAPAAPSATPAATPTQEQPAAAIPAATPSTAPASPPVVHARFLVVIDAAHGGDETGAAFSPKLLEKDITLSLARKLHAALEARGISAVLLRDSDAALTPDQRATVTSADRAAVYIALHAGTPGQRVRVYTALLPRAENRPGTFVPWQQAQAAYLDQSSALAAAVVDGLSQSSLAAAQLAGPVRPLNNIAAPAVAVEISPRGPSPDSMADPKYQDSVALAIASGIATARGKLEAMR